MKKKIKQKSVSYFITEFGKGLTSLEGYPEEVVHFDVSYNQLKNLIGGPKIVKYYYASDNQLESLEGAPEEVDVFDVSYNPTLKNTDGIPKRIGILFLYSTIRSSSQFTEYPYKVETIYFDNKIPIEDVKEIVSNIKEVQYVYMGGNKYTKDKILKMNK